MDWEDDLPFENTKANNRDFIQFVDRIISNWYWFALCGLLGIVLAFLYLRYSVPVYNVHAKLLVSDDKKGGGMLSSSALGDLSGLMGAKNSVDNEVEVLLTGDLMREMVLSDSSYISYYEVGQIHNVPVLKTPFRVSILSDPDSILMPYNFKINKSNSSGVELSNSDTTLNTAFGAPFSIPGIGLLRIDAISSVANLKDVKSYGFSILPIDAISSSLMEALSVSVTNKNVSTIDLTLISKLPLRGERQLKMLIEKYVERNLHDKNVIADSTLSFINARLTTITQELSGVEDRISGYKQSTQLSDISEQSRILLENSATYTKSIAEVEVQLSSLDAMSSYLKDVKNPRVVPSSVVTQDVAFNALVGRYNELILEREKLLLANTEGNPLVQNVTGQIASVREDMISNVASTRRSLQLARDKQMQMSNQLTSQIQRVPTIERGYIDLARLQQIKQAQYIFLQEKWEETAISRTANVSNSKVIDSPKAESDPFSPKRKMSYALGLLLGLAIPLGVIYGKDLLNVRVRTIEDVDHHNKLPVLGMIAHSEDTEQVVITNTSRSQIAEQFRAIRTNLEFALNTGNTILFTSSMSGEGKSYVALNLAVSLALLDKKVLIMELDLRKPSITSKLKLKNGVGFSHYIIRKEMQVEDIIINSGVHDQVDLIQAGAIPPNPAELLISERATSLMKDLKERYDYILMDAPPVGMVTDAQLLSRYADLCLYLVRQGYTYKEQLMIPNELVANKKIQPIQLIINDVKARGGYYGGYGYGYGYGNYEEAEKKPWWKFRR